MKIILLLAVLMACGLSEVQGDAQQFLRMIRYVTGKRLFYPYGFNNCQCNMEDKRTDKCCSAHDCCYLTLKNKGCKPKKINYSYKFRDQSIICGSGTTCQKEVCACDKAAAYCMKNNPGNYHKKYYVSYYRMKENKTQS